MALASTTIAEIRTGGSDANNGGLFDPGKVSAGGFADGAATGATTSAPVFSSASYTFLAADVGAWLYIDSGTNWTPGWYQIASVAAGAATLSAAIGAGVLAGNISMTTVVGCASVASPTAAKWTIDYSQQAAAQFTYTDLASAGTGLTVSSALKPFGKQQVGNAIVITGGTNFNAGRYVIASVAAAVATVVGPTNITTGAGATGTGGQGGAFGSPGLAIGLSGTFLKLFIQAGGTFSVTSATPNITAGCLNNNLTAGCGVFGYSTARTVGNTDAKPVIQLNVATATLLAGATSTRFSNLSLDGNNQTASIPCSTGLYLRCVFQNFKSPSSQTNQNVFVQCRATLNAGAVFGGSSVDCEAYANTATQFLTTSGALNVHLRPLAYNNTGASTDGALIATFGGVVGGTFYGNGRDGVRFTGTTGYARNCHAEANSGVGFNAAAASVPTNIDLDHCSTYNNTGGATSGVPVNRNAVIGTSSAFTNAGATDFSLNATAGGGAALRGAGSPGVFPAGLTTGYVDIGAVQHADPTVLLRNQGMDGGMNG